MKKIIIICLIGIILLSSCAQKKEIEKAEISAKMSEIVPISSDFEAIIDSVEETEDIENLIIVGKQAETKAQEFKNKVELLVINLKKTCSSQKDIIIELETYLQDLEQRQAVLKQALQSKNSAIIEQQIQKIGKSIKAITTSLKAIKAACLA